MCEDRSEEYEYLYAQLVPSDATLERLPFIVRDFIVGKCKFRTVLIIKIEFKFFSHGRW